MAGIQSTLDNANMKLVNKSFLLSLYAFTLWLVSPVCAGQDIESLDKLIINTRLQSNTKTALPVSVLSNESLPLKAALTLGDSLKNEPGMASQSFGPGVGQPVIRGQSGARVRVLQNGLNTLDVASLSPDHANSVEPL